MTVDELIAHHDVTAVLMRYYRGVDRVDVELIRSCFWEDATADYGAFGFVGTRDAFVDFLRAPEALPALERTMHLAGNVLVEIDGDTAHTEAYCVAHHVGGPTHRWAGRFALNWLRYVDRFERRDGAWRIARRVVIVEWGAELPVDRWMAYPEPYMGRRDPDDLSYDG